MIKAVIFDLDGTIGNTLPICIKSFKASVEPLICREISEKEIVENFGPSEEGVIMNLLNENFDKGIQNYLINYDKFHYMSLCPFDGIIDLLKYLKSQEIILGIVTGKGANSTKITLEKYGIFEYFDIIETGSKYGPVKKKGIKNILEKYSLNTNEAVYIGDSVSDIIDCKEISIPIYSAAWDELSNYEQLNMYKPDKIFLKPIEILNYFKSIN